MKTITYNRMSIHIRDGLSKDQSIVFAKYKGIDIEATIETNQLDFSNNKKERLSRTKIYRSIVRSYHDHIRKKEWSVFLGGEHRFNILADTDQEAETMARKLLGNQQIRIYEKNK